MYTFTRKHGSQRVSAQQRILLAQEADYSQLVLKHVRDHGTSVLMYTFIVPETQKEWDDLLKEVQEGRRQFADKQKRNNELTALLDKKGY